MIAPVHPARLDSLEPGTISNALTIDVEDYFQVSAFAPYIERSAWETTPCRIERNIECILDLLEQRKAKATFFTLGWLAQRYPRIVRDITSQGHEVASHGQAHLRATEQSPAQFDNDIRDAKKMLEDTAGVAVCGYRAPSFSIGQTNLWAFDRIAAAGYRYSSSVYPVQHDHYGWPAAPRFPFRTEAGVLEIPVSTARVFGRNLPAGGGGYFRLAPYALSRWAIKRVNQVDKQPAIFYFHPWEIDPQQPRVKGVGLKTRFRHYVNLNRTERRLGRLLSDFRWDRVDRVFDLDAA